MTDDLFAGFKRLLRENDADLRNRFRANQKNSEVFSYFDPNFRKTHNF